MKTAERTAELEAVKIDDAPLIADAISVHYGGVQALADVHLRVQAGEIVGLIGGNGAGKTTFMDCVSGYVTPERGGRLSAFGEDIGRLAPELRPYRGIVRSFQNAFLYPQLSVDEALLVAMERHRPSGLFSSLIGSRASRAAEAEKRGWVDELVSRLGLEPYRSKRIGQLSTGTRRVVDLATTMAQRPKLILFDEPTTGLAQRETEAFGPLVHWVRDTLDCAVLIIEHDMPLITSVADRLYALEAGRVIAEGTPKQVTSDARVIASYLGYDEAAIRRSGRRSGRSSGRRSGTARLKR
jgi:ABC-type branched-subunit amino acid transport system ATPase component